MIRQGAAANFGERYFLTDGGFSIGNTYLASYPTPFAYTIVFFFFFFFSDTDLRASNAAVRGHGGHGTAHSSTIVKMCTNTGGAS